MKWVALIVGPGLLFIVLVAINVFASVRVVQVAREILRGDLRPRNMVCGAIGGLMWLLFAACLLVVIGVVIGTFFFMSKTMSGIPLGLAVSGFPLVWVFSEMLFRACFTCESAR